MLVAALCVAHAARRCLTQCRDTKPICVAKRQRPHGVFSAGHRMLRVCWQMQAGTRGPAATVGGEHRASALRRWLTCAWQQMRGGMSRRVGALPPRIGSTWRQRQPPRPAEARACGA